MCRVQDYNTNVWHRIRFYPLCSNTFDMCSIFYLDYFVVPELDHLKAGL